MKDIDFDELDKAVNSLMGSAPKENPAKEDNTTTLVTPESATEVPAEEPQAATRSAMDVTSQDIDTEAVIVPSPGAEQVVELEPEKILPPAASIRPAPSRGRFMDMVRPAKDIRKAPSLVSRQGVTLQPSTSTQPEATPSSEIVAQQPTVDVDLVAQTAVVQELEDTASMAATSNESVLDTATPAVQESSFGEAEDTIPLSSPFLPDAKVEKRPLGRPAEATPFVDLSAELAEDAGQLAPESPAPIEDLSISQAEDAQRPEAPLPAELDSKLLNIETGADAPHQETVFPQSVNPGEAAPPVPAPMSAESISPVMDAPRTMAAASIPQQYKLETGHGEEVPAGAIYDTQPLAHPAKSKPGWLWIVAIVLILLLGAVGGAAVYYLGLL